MLQCVAVCCSVLQCDMNHLNTRDFAFIGGKITLQCVLQCAAVRYNLLQCVAVCCSFLQCVVPLKSMGSKHTYLVHMCDMTCSCVWHDSCVTWLVHVFAMTHLWVCYDMTHSYVWRDSFIRVTWLIHMCTLSELAARTHCSVCCSVL